MSNGLIYIMYGSLNGSRGRPGTNQFSVQRYYAYIKIQYKRETFVLFHSLSIKSMIRYMLSLQFLLLLFTLAEVYPVAVSPSLMHKYRTSIFMALSDTLASINT